MKSGAEQKLPRHSIRIVHSHRELAPNHFLFLAVFLRRQSRVHHRVGQNVERGRDPIFRHVDPINGAIERSVSVDVSANVLDFLRDRIGRTVFRSLEKHVLEDVRQPRAEMLVFIDAAGRAPRLHARHRRAAIFLHNDGEPIRQNPLLRGIRRGHDHGRTISRRCGFKIGGAQHGCG